MRQLLIGITTMSLIASLLGMLGGSPAPAQATQPPAVSSPAVPAPTSPPTTAPAQPVPQPQAPAWMGYQKNIFGFEGGDGTAPNSGQFTDAIKTAFIKDNPQWAGKDLNTQDAQSALYNWNGKTQIAPQLTSAGLDPNNGALFYSAYALGPKATAALAHAPDGASAADIVQAVSPDSYKGNAGLFKGNPSVAQLSQRLYSIATTGKLGDDQPADATSGPPSLSPPPDNSALQAKEQQLLAQVGAQPNIVAPHQSALAAFFNGVGNSGGHLFSGIGSVLNNGNTNLQFQNEANQERYDDAVKGATATIEGARLGAVRPLGPPQQDPHTGQWSMTVMDGMGQIYSQPMSGTPMSAANTAAHITDIDNRFNATAKNKENASTAGVGAQGQQNGYTINTVSPPGASSGVVPPPPTAPQTAPPAPTPTPTPTPDPVSSAQAAAVAAQANTPPLPTSSDPVDSAAGTYLQSAIAAAPRAQVPAIARANAVDNNKNLTRIYADADSAANNQEATARTIAALKSDPSVLPSNYADAINNALSSYFGGQPIFAQSSNGQMQLTQAFLKQVGSASMGEILHDNMHISRITQNEVQLTQPAVVNGHMSPGAALALMDAALNNQNHTIATAKLFRAMQRGGQFPMTAAGSVAGLEQQIGNDLWSGKYPKLFQPTEAIGGTNATPGAVTGITNNIPMSFKPGQTTDLGNGFTVTFH